MTAQLFLLASVVLCTSFFLVARRRLDAFTVAHFSAVLYFLPGLVGYTLSPVTPASPIKLPVQLAPEAIWIMVTVTVAITAGALLWDRFDLARRDLRWTLQDASLAPWIAAGLGAAGFVLTVLESGGAVFLADKRTVMEAIGRGHLLWEMASGVAVVLAFSYRQLWPALLGWLLLLVDLWIGFRYAFATTFIATTVLWLRRPGPMQLGAVRRRHVAVVLLVGLAMISYQNLKEPLRQRNWDEIRLRLTTPLWYVQGVLTSEPFTTQTVLNEIVRRDFRTGTDHLWSATSHLILFSTALGDEDVRFNDVYQPALFPTVDHGLANNMWGQMWSAGDWTLLVCFILVFLMGLAFISRALRSPDPAVRAWAALATAYWAFYVHRNELLTFVGFQKQLLLVWAACVVVAIAARRAGRSHGRLHGTA